MATSTSTKTPGYGKKWCFLKKGAFVYTVYNHNKAALLTSKGFDPGYIVSLSDSNGQNGKIVVRYSNDNKHMKLSLEFFTGSDSLGKMLFTEVSNTGNFLRRAKELYGVEIDSSNKEKSSNSSKRKVADHEIAQPSAKRNRPRLQDNTSPESQETGIEATNTTDSSGTTDASGATDSVSDEMLPYLVNKDLVPIKVLVTSLKEARSEFLLREIDEVFVKGLMKEFQENRSFFIKPLVVVVKGVKSASEFDKEIIDSYELEVIGGNHRREALQQLFKVEQDDQFKWVNVLLFCEMPKALVLKLAARHNRMDSFCHNMTTQEKVKFCHKILMEDFQGKKSSNWRDLCVEILNTSKDSLEFVFLLSGLEEDTFEALLDVFKGYEGFMLKGQMTSSAKQTKNMISGVVQKPSLVGSKFKCLRGLPNDALKQLLTDVKETKISFKEMKKNAEEWKGLNCLRATFVKMAGVKSWQDIEERFPLWSAVETLKPFIKSIKKGKPDESFKLFIQRGLKCGGSHETATDQVGVVEGASSLWYSAIKMTKDWKVTPALFENLTKFGGAELILLQDEKDWNDNLLQSIVRAVCSLNTRQKVNKYTILIRKTVARELSDCTPDGIEETLYIVSPNNLPHAGTTLTTAVDKAKVLFVGNVELQSLNFLMKESEEKLMTQIVQTFLPSHGTVLELGSNEGSLDLLKVCVRNKANLVSLYDSQDTVHLFLYEAAKLLKDLDFVPESDEDDEDENA